MLSSVSFEGFVRRGPAAERASAVDGFEGRDVDEVGGVVGGGVAYHPASPPAGGGDAPVTVPATSSVPTASVNRAGAAPVTSYR